ncbi:hypothetical protein G7Y89_g7026 [Cudoniella acicularis]|uniref:Uncharacterized protein n=1 Tax=Cudoniella acicularis TaxID=354080 RepID=A0A8H4RLK3_9HELO|nr:hypothetical protein G7Y89_g7026 [Cudoniella acicularis]
MLVSDKPWKPEVKSSATVLVDIAKRCRHRNESSWRYACEPVILGRLSSEVCCKNCRKRIWRLEIEVTQTENTAAAEGLRDRQNARESCRCPRTARSQDHFYFRVDKEVHHSPEIALKLKKGEKPDRVYGLRQARNIENLLHDVAKRQLEDDDEAVKRQTAFSIRTLLETQNRLRTATGRHSKWRSGPFIWFLANKEEDWRLYAAYTQPALARPHNVGTIDYRVIDAWCGSILTQDEALQLLLLVDYIFDWARDVYREDIIKELRVLASGENGNASTMYTDSDIYSTRHIDSMHQPDEANGNLDEFKQIPLRKKLFPPSTPLQQVLLMAIMRKAKKLCVDDDGIPLLDDLNDDGSFRIIVYFIYLSFKRGNLEPQEPFARVSSRLDQQDRLNCDVKPFFEETPHASSDGCVLVTATCYPYKGNQANGSEATFCACLTANGPSLPTQQVLATITKIAFETRDFYHTTQNHGSLNKASLAMIHEKYREIWNLRNTYGVYSEGFGFLDFLEDLGSERPGSRGSSRALTESGSQLYDRNFSPWHDPRTMYRSRRPQIEELKDYLAVRAVPSLEGTKPVVLAPPFSKITIATGAELEERLDGVENRKLSSRDRERIWSVDNEGDWVWNLEFNARLNEPFENIYELQKQWGGF